MTTSETYSIILVLLTALAAGLVGSFALMKRMSLAGDVVSHIALPGLGVAMLLKINPLLGAAIALLLGTVLIWHLQKRPTMTTDVAIGVIFTAALAIGTVLTPSEDLIEALFGGFQGLTLLWFVLGLLAVSVIVVFVVTFRHQLILSLFSPELAAATGVNVSLLNLYFLLVFSLTVLLGVRFLGSLLVGALIIIPAAIGRQLTHTLTAFLVTSALASVLSVILGFSVSHSYSHLSIGQVNLNLTLGPAIIAVATILFLLSLLRKKV
ncbi:MAG TPA: metal ABC transporter permease [Pyrinomonadaceae bacterium]|nr:metal ABC transporter permease [Pyrinomonadaceae bacterium]